MSIEQPEKPIPPHHEQQTLCTTRLPYRQGRKLTAVKVYTVNNESNHLLVFGVPALNLRKEAKSLFLRYGSLKQFTISLDHPKEVFTETYHASFDRIQSARIAKRMLDTKNFYGGSLHISYAPELETLEETRKKLLQRTKDVTYRLRNIDKQKCIEPQTSQIVESKEVDVENKIADTMKVEYGPIQNEVSEKLNMGEINTIKFKRKAKNVVIEKKFKPNNDIEVIDFISTERETITNINEALNYNKFGNEDIRIVSIKPVNTIKFNKKT